MNKPEQPTAKIESIADLLKAYALDIDHAVTCAKEYVPDYPWTLNTAPAAIWALGESCKGIDAANADLHTKLELITTENDELRKTTQSLRGQNEDMRETIANLKNTILDLTNGIKEHHKQKGDDLCWMDDDLLYVTAGLPPRDNRVGDKEAMLANCKRFIENRCQDGGWRSYAELEAVLRIANEDKEWYQQRYDELLTEVQQKDAAIATAVKEERKACADIVEHFVISEWGLSPVSVRESLAELILARG